MVYQSRRGRGECCRTLCRLARSRAPREDAEIERDAREDITERMVAFHATRPGISPLLSHLWQADHKVNKKEEVMVIDSAHNDCFDAYYAKPPTSLSPSPSTHTDQPENSLLNSFFDGSASWFT